MERRYLNSVLLEGVVLQNPMTISPKSAGNLIVRFDVECDNSHPSADGKRVDDSATVPVIAIGDFGKDVFNVIRAGMVVRAIGRLQIERWAYRGEPRAWTVIVSGHVEFIRDGVRVVIDDEA